jgi:hypothetical protein
METFQTDQRWIDSGAHQGASPDGCLHGQATGHENRVNQHREPVAFQVNHQMFSTYSGRRSSTGQVQYVQYIQYIRQDDVYFAIEKIGTNVYKMFSAS